MQVAESPRLIIRQLTHQDATALPTILSDEQVMKFSVRGVCDEQAVINFVDNTIDQQREYGFCVWGVFVKDSNELIGISGLLPYCLKGEDIIHINYRFARAHWGKGYAIEAVNAVVDYAKRQLSLKTLYAVIDPANTSSVKLAEKAGFAFLRQESFMSCDVNLYLHFSD